jgi:chaperonin GroEL (HSP60 family)
MRYVTAGVNPMIMKIGIDKAVKHVVAEIRAVSKPVSKDDWEKVATISAQNKVIGQKIAEAIGIVGENGVIEMETDAKYYESFYVDHLGAGSEWDGKSEFGLIAAFYEENESK